jgi:hypothetical protein
MNKAIKGIGRGLYITLACFLAFVALGMSFLSDGTVPVYIHVIIPVIVLVIFLAPLAIWHRINTATVGSPLPVRLRQHQDKIIIGGLLLWVIGVAVSYFAARGN